jgi:uncharacterized repeat protein (TIGR03803 family)
VLYRFTGIPGVDGMNPEQGLVRDAKGNLYGTTFQGGTYSNGNSYGTVFKIDSTGKETVLHSFDPYTPPYDDGAWPLGGSLLRDSAGNLYGTTYLGGLGYRGMVLNWIPTDPRLSCTALAGLGTVVFPTETWSKTRREIFTA